MVYLEWSVSSIGMIVGWQTQSDLSYAEVWRVLDLSGLTNSVRESLNYTKAGFVYLNGIRVSSLKERVQLGSTFTLELRFPNGRVKSEEITLVATNRLIERTPRQTEPGTSQHLTDPDKYFRRG